jgi:hypothetical protein
MTRARAFFYGREIQPGIGDNLINSALASVSKMAPLA